jgi:hypothetical protein
MEYIEYMQQNKSLKPTVTRVTPFAEMAKPTPRYGGLIPPLYLPEDIRYERTSVYSGYSMPELMCLQTGTAEHPNSVYR